jgi:hypothetical protein
MGRYQVADDDEEDDDLSDPDASDMDPDDEDEDYSVNSETSTDTCPHCGAQVYEDAEQCPVCGQYITDENAPRTSHPRWVVWTAVVLLVPLIYALLRWFF